MAINPNTDFTTGAVLTAAQQNRFPRGVMALSNLTANLSYLNSETTRTSVTFTAEANRYYRISFFEPDLTNANASVNTFVFRLDTTGGTVLGTAIQYYNANNNAQLNMSVVTTLSAGSRTIFARGSTNAGTATTGNASATKPAYLLVEDLGPS
jgi:hypothetical protein